MSARPPQKDNSGVLFVNDRKKQDSQPDRTGNCTIGGKEYWISGWVKESSTQKGKVFLSLAFQPKDDPAGAAGKGDI